jgi:hypothetical protein
MVFVVTIYVAAKGQESVQQLTDSVRQNVQRELELSPDAVIVESTETIEAKLFAKKLKAEWIIDTRPA